MRRALLLVIAIGLAAGCTTASTPPPPKEEVEKPAITQEELAKADELEAPVDEDVTEKGPPPPLPSWAHLPSKKPSLQELRARVDTLRLTLEDGNDIRIPRPFKIHQIGTLTEFDGVVVIPVRVEHKNYWIRGYLDTNQIEIWIPGGTKLYDGPRGSEVGYVLDKIPVEVKKISDGWLQVAYTMNKKCSPTELVAWVSKKAMSKKHAGRVPLPARYKKIPKKRLPVDMPLFEVYGRPRGENLIVQVPLCHVDNQIIAVGPRRGKRVRLYFRESPNAPVVIYAWADRDVASDNPPKGSCTCGEYEEERSSFVPPDEEDVYQVRISLPLYLKPDKKAKPVGMITKGPMPKGAVQDLNDPSWGKIFLGDPFKLKEFYVPYHENYFLP